MLASELQDLKKLNMRVEYEQWKFRMEVCLLQEGLWKLVIGKEVKPSSSDLDCDDAWDEPSWRDERSWEERDQKASGILLAGLKGDIAVYMRANSGTTAEMWTHISEIYGQVSTKEDEEGTNQSGVGKSESNTRAYYSKHAC